MGGAFGQEDEAGAEVERGRLADHFGFLPLEVYKLDPRIGSLRIGDFDGDGTGDAAIANNGRSRLDFLLSGGGAGRGPTSSGVNEIRYDTRMGNARLALNRGVASLRAGDFNEDGRLDLAYYGLPPVIAVLTNEGGAKFRETARIAVEAAVNGPSALQTGDLDGDGHLDLALLRAKDVLIFRGKGDGRFGEAERLPHTATNGTILKLADLDGDGKLDLAILGQDRDAPLRARLNTAGGRLGPEQRFRLPRPRAIEFANVDGAAGDELLTVEAETGRVQVLKLRSGELTGEDATGRLNFYPMPEGPTRDRDMDVGDLDGDGKLDVVACDPGNTQLLAMIQEPGIGPGPAQAFPGLLGMAGVRTIDTNGDGRSAVAVLSKRERQIGLCEYREGRLTFPSPLEIAGEPLAMEAGDFTGDGKAELMYVSREGDRKGATLRGIAFDGEGNPRALTWGETSFVETGLTSGVKALRLVDVNGDGKRDAVIFPEAGSPVAALRRTSPDGGPEPAPEVFGGNLGPLGAAPEWGISDARLREGDGAGLLAAQGTVARLTSLGADGRWSVRDQFNPDVSGAQIQGLTVIDRDGDGRRELALWDRSTKKVYFLADREGVFRVTDALDVGAIEFTRLRAADLNGDGIEDLVIEGQDKFAVLITGKTGYSFETLTGYESNRKEATFADLAAGDLNGDGRPDVAVTDVGEHFVEILTFDERGELTRALAFRVFEEKSFRGGGDLIEPRELAIGDVDGDGRADLLLISHDRVLIYRQDSGEVAAEAKADAEAGAEAEAEAGGNGKGGEEG